LKHIRKEDVTFFEKKVTKKTFAPGGCGNAVATAPRSESFLLLFFKKEALPFSFTTFRTPSARLILLY
jgi:hypothetical protein